MSERMIQFWIEKQCSVCGKVKPFSEFSKLKADYDKFSYQCKACGRAYNAKRRAEKRAEKEAREKEYAAELNKRRKREYAILYGEDCNV